MNGIFEDVHTCIHTYIQYVYAHNTTYIPVMYGPFEYASIHNTYMHTNDAHTCHVEPIINPFEHASIRKYTQTYTHLSYRAHNEPV